MLVANIFNDAVLLAGTDIEIMKRRFQKKKSSEKVDIALEECLDFREVQPADIPKPKKEQPVTMATKKRMERREMLSKVKTENTSKEKNTNKEILDYIDKALDSMLEDDSDQPTTSTVKETKNTKEKSENVTTNDSVPTTDENTTTEETKSDTNTEEVVSSTVVENAEEEAKENGKGINVVNIVPDTEAVVESPVIFVPDESEVNITIKVDPDPDTAPWRSPDTDEDFPRNFVDNTVEDLNEVQNKSEDKTDFSVRSTEPDEITNQIYLLSDEEAEEIYEDISKFGIPFELERLPGKRAVVRFKSSDNSIYKPERVVDWNRSTEHKCIQIFVNGGRDTSFVPIDETELIFESLRVPISYRKLRKIHKKYNISDSVFKYFSRQIMPQKYDWAKLQKSLSKVFNDKRFNKCRYRLNSYIDESNFSIVSDQSVTTDYDIQSMKYASEPIMITVINGDPVF